MNQSVFSRHYLVADASPRARNNISSRTDGGIETSTGPAWMTGQRREGEEKCNLVSGIRCTPTTAEMFSTHIKTIHQSRYRIPPNFFEEI